MCVTRSDTWETRGESRRGDFVWRPVLIIAVTYTYVILLSRVVVWTIERGAVGWPMGAGPTSCCNVLIYNNLCNQLPIIKVM